MDYLKTTDEEEAAKRLRRKTDGFPAEVWAMAILGAGSAAAFMFDQAAPASNAVEFARVSFAGACGAVIGGALAALVRVRRPYLVPLAATSGIALLLALVTSDPPAPLLTNPTATTAMSSPVSVLDVSSLPKDLPTTLSITVAEESPSSTEPELASAGPVPPAAGAATSSTETSVTTDTFDPVGTVATETSQSVHEEQQTEPAIDDEVSCTIDVVGTSIVPTAGCEGRVGVRMFGEPRNGPSAWQLPESAELLMASISPDDPWSRVGQEAGTAPGCVFDLDAATTEPSTTEPTTSADRIRVIELRNAPTGTRITLWAECDASKEQSFDPTAGWVIEVVQP